MACMRSHAPPARCAPARVHHPCPGQHMPVPEAQAERTPSRAREAELTAAATTGARPQGSGSGELLSWMKHANET
eukprot:2276972-Alexandrium_andersonii.AAC.1